MFAFHYHLLGSVGEEDLNPSLGLASGATKIQLEQKILVWDLVKGFRKSPV